ncbi:hypothetical protein BD770DRAFT_386793 [Pilaira anomala]|nr:hypothetical protein BD770DRAFT_386793 [Pilaira anomala]
MTTFIQKSIKKVAIIGGGPGGLAAARALRDQGTFDSITIFERNDHTGGTWKYSAETNPPPPIPSTNALKVDTTLQSEQLFSPIYAELHTNLPKSVMCFQDAPFPSESPMYLHHTQVLQYLTDLAKRENVLPWVRFSTLVEKAEFHHDDGWTLTVKQGNHPQSIEHFDAVVVATGHYAVPYVPDLPGLVELNQNKRISIMHSREYRVPDMFKDKKILVIGGGSSAIDIVRETSAVAHTVYQSIRTQTELSRQAIIAQYAENIHQTALVKRIVHDNTTTTQSSWVEFEDGQVLKDLDWIVFGTGYLYSFPFLPFQKDNLIVTGQKVHHLVHSMFYQPNPTLCFLGLPIRVVPMPLMQRQAIVMARYWSGLIPMLPHDDTTTTTTTTKCSSDDGNNDDRTDFIMGVAREVEYSEKLGAWAEGWLDSNRDGWKSTHPLTGRITDQWLTLRKNALALRRDYLGY